MKALVQRRRLSSRDFVATYVPILAAVVAGLFVSDVWWVQLVVTLGVALALALAVQYLWPGRRARRDG